MNNEIRKQLLGLLQERLERIGIRESEPGAQFDLVKTGLLNSLEFVDLVATLEKMNGIEIDFEKALAAGDFTTIGGIVRTFSNINNP
jgi:acyl carrier protein